MCLKLAVFVTNALNLWIWAVFFLQGGSILPWDILLFQEDFFVPFLSVVPFLLFVPHRSYSASCQIIKTEGGVSESVFLTCTGGTPGQGFTCPRVRVQELPVLTIPLSPPGECQHPANGGTGDDSGDEDDVLHGAEAECYNRVRASPAATHPFWLHCSLPWVVVAGYCSLLCFLMPAPLPDQLVAFPVSGEVCSQDRRYGAASGPKSSS